jgi:hypothetical protein
VGFPIRTSADRGLVDGSPQLFAVTHVLHRFLAPRHPPLALCSLERTRFCSYVRGEPRTTRCSCLLCSSQGAQSYACGARGSSTQRRHRRSSDRGPTPSKRKRRQARRRHLQREDQVLRSRQLRRRTHQCTNWVSKHRVIDDHRRCGMDSLERR